MKARIYVSLVLLLLTVQFSQVVAQTSIGPDVGSIVKDFELNDQNSSLKTLGELTSSGATALVVVQSAGWCTQSKEHILQLQQQADHFEEAGLKIACLSYDNINVLDSFATREGIEFPLLADPGSKVIKQLGLVNSKFKKGTIRYGLSHPATILLDRQGKVIHVAAGLSNPTRLLKLWKSKKSDTVPEEKRADFISIKGNRFVDETGSQMRFKGVGIADPYKILADGRWKREHFEALKKWGPNIIRIPVHPGNFRELGQDKYLQLLDEAIRWCEELEMYVIIDWHSIGNLKTEVFESDEKVTSMKETLMFWNLISERYADNPTLAFYEVFNEPATRYMGYGDCSWPQWKLMVEKIIDTIRSNDKRTIVLVGGLDWAYDLRDAAADPISRKGVSYVAHPYPGKSKAPREDHWEKHFGFFASRFPIFVTETGFYRKGDVEHFVDDGGFGDQLLKYLDKHQVSWCAWIFDPDWSPALITSYEYVPTDSGAFFKKAMLERK